MKIIEASAPLSLEQLKEYFLDKNVFYKIDYDSSELKGDMFLTYLSNLEIPCDIVVKEKETLLELLESYLHFKQIVSVPLLEEKTTDILFQYKGIIEKEDSDFIKKNKEILDHWVSRLDSLTIFNMWIVNEPLFKEFAESFEKDDTDSLEGINFVSLLDNENFFTYYNVVDEANLKFYSTYFEEYMFKGNNLYSFWANSNNIMFLLSWGLSTGNLDIEEYFKAMSSDLKELEQSVPSS